MNETLRERRKTLSIWISAIARARNLSGEQVSYDLREAYLPTFERKDIVTGRKVAEPMRIGDLTDTSTPTLDEFMAKVRAFGRKCGVELLDAKPEQLREAG